MAFTIKELREMTKLAGCRALLDPGDFEQSRQLMSSEGVVHSSSCSLEALSFRSTTTKEATD